MERDPDPPARRGSIEFGHASSSQRIARVVLAAALVLLGLWILHGFLAALVWAVVLAIALWPLYQRLVRVLAGFRRQALAPIAATLLVGLICLVPFVYVVIEGARETRIAVQFVIDARRSGIPVPEWVPQLPAIGHSVGDWWRANLSDPNAVQELFGRVNTRSVAESARQYGGAILHRLILFGFTLLTLFFLFRDGNALNRRLIDLSDRLLGAGGERIGRHMVQAVLGTVNGLVLVGLGEGVLLGIAYLLAGLPHPLSIAALTGVLAVIPFGAPLVFGAAALYLVATGSTVAAAGVFGFGVLVVFAADHLVRPVLIGGAARLPFLWVLLGILGGLESFGILGLFLGPAIMAAVISLWRDWTDGPPADDVSGSSRPPAR